MRPSTARVERWTAEEAMKLGREEAIELWKTLPAPAPGEMDGEYTGYVRDGGDEQVRKAKAAFFFDEHSRLGYWMGKAYATTVGLKGEGYNRWRRPGGKVERYLRFSTEIAPSGMDGKPSLIMYYRAFNNRMGNVDLIDEIRKLDDGLYLGIYTTSVPVAGFAEVKREGERSEVEVFALTGAIGKWVGADDEGAERK